jgi:hypothetical protein
MQVCSRSVRTPIIGHVKLPPRSKVWKILCFHRDNKKATIFVLYNPPPPHTHTLSSEALFSASHNHTTSQMVPGTVILGNYFSSLCKFTREKKIQGYKWIITWIGLLCSPKSPETLFLYLLLKIFQILKNSWF